MLEGGHFGQCIAIEKEKIQVTLLKKVSDGQWILDDNPDNERWFDRGAVLTCAPIANLKNMRHHKQAWKKIGLRLVRSTESCDYFCDNNANHDDVGDGLGSDSEEEEEEEPGKRGMHGYCSDGGFVVPDSDAEPFTHANPNESAFVAEVHEAVHDFNSWTPTTPEERRFYNWMNRFEQKYGRSDDNRHFEAGTSVEYARPPKRKKQKKEF